MFNHNKYLVTVGVGGAKYCISGHPMISHIGVAVTGYT